MISGPRILHLCTSDLQGGAARSAYRLHRSLSEVGLSSKLCVKNRQSKDSSVAMLKPVRVGRSLGFKVRYFFQQRLLARYLSQRKGSGMFSLDLVPCNHESLPEHDILHLHWLSSFVDHIDLAEMLSSTIGIVWTMHDMNPFTGGCHFSGECKKYEELCCSCPILDSNNKWDLAKSAFGRKLGLINKLDRKCTRFVAPSKWLAKAAESSRLLHGHSISIIPYGIDTDVFRPHHGESMRSILNIPHDALVILVLAARLSDLRKGGAPFFDALSCMTAFRDDKIIIVSVGKDAPNLDGALSHRSIGMVDNEDLLVALYSCADVLLMPTLEDNLPNAALEAISCGVPVVSYETGGMRDIIGEQEAGIVVDRGDLDGLLSAAASLLADTTGRRIKKLAARARAQKMFSRELQASRYKSLYEDMLQEDNSSD